MMKLREMSKERRMAVKVGNVLFFGGLLVGTFAPGVNAGLLLGVEAVGVAIELLAICGFGRKAF